MNTSKGIYVSKITCDKTNITKINLVLFDIKKEHLNHAYELYTLSLKAESYFSSSKIAQYFIGVGLNISQTGIYICILNTMSYAAVIDWVIHFLSSVVTSSDDNLAKLCSSFIKYWDTINVSDLKDYSEKTLSAKHFNSQV